VGKASPPARVYHWKHGWIPLDSVANKAKQGTTPGKIPQKSPPQPLQGVLRNQAKMLQEIDTNGGFTYDPKRGGLLEVGKDKGFAVAVPGTETVVGVEKVNAEDIHREDFAKGVASVIMKHKALIDRGAVVGGWYSPERNTYMVEVTQILPADKKDIAIQAGIDRKQEAIFDLSTGETISTGGHGDADSVALPRNERGELVSSFRSDPTPEEIAAAKYYTGPGYKHMNGPLRARHLLTPTVEHRRAHLDAFLAKSIVRKDTTVYRGVQGGSWLPTNLPPGHEITDLGYVSTAEDPSGSYGGDTRMIIKVPKGFHAVDLYGAGITHHADEKELLLPRGTRLRVISDVESGGMRTINAEAVAAGV
jgi:hypothetical protein